MFVAIPLVKRLIEKFSEEEVGADIEVTSFTGVLTVRLLMKMLFRSIYAFLKLIF